MSDPLLSARCGRAEERRDPVLFLAPLEPRSPLKREKRVSYVSDEMIAIPPPFLVLSEFLLGMTQVSPF